MGVFYLRIKDAHHAINAHRHQKQPRQEICPSADRPALGGPNKAKKSLGPLGSASENVDVNMNVYVYVNVSADRAPPARTKQEIIGTT